MNWGVPREVSAKMMFTPEYAPVELLPSQDLTVKILGAEAFAYFAGRACGVLAFRAP